MKFKTFLGTSVGKAMMTLFFILVSWSVTAFLIIHSQTFLVIMMPFFAFFGWKALNRIQPSMFLWMSWVGWIIYFFVKLTIAVLIGSFVAPYVWAKEISEGINESLKQNNEG